MSGVEAVGLFLSRPLVKTSSSFMLRRFRVESSHKIRSAGTTVEALRFCLVELEPVEDFPLLVVASPRLNSLLLKLLLSPLSEVGSMLLALLLLFITSMIYHSLFDV